MKLIAGELYQTTKFDVAIIRELDELKNINLIVPKLIEIKTKQILMFIGFFKCMSKNELRPLFLCNEILIDFYCGGAGPELDYYYSHILKQIGEK